MQVSARNRDLCLAALAAGGREREAMASDVEPSMSAWARFQRTRVLARADMSAMAVLMVELKHGFELNKATSEVAFAEEGEAACIFCVREALPTSAAGGSDTCSLGVELTHGHHEAALLTATAGPGKAAFMLDEAEHEFFPQQFDELACGNFFRASVGGCVLPEGTFRKYEQQSRTGVGRNTSGTVGAHDGRDGVLVDLKAEFVRTGVDRNTLGSDDGGGGLLNMEAEVFFRVQVLVARFQVMRAASR